MLAIWVAIFSAAATSILIFGNTLTLALLVVVAVSALLLHAPGILSLASWALFTVVPEAVGNNELASGWTSLTYRSLVGSVDLADIVPALLLFYPTYTYGLDTRVQGVQIPPMLTASDRFRNIAQWYIKIRRVASKLPWASRSRA